MPKRPLFPVLTGLGLALSMAFSAQAQALPLDVGLRSMLQVALDYLTL